jgi:hypothetical protein
VGGGATGVTARLVPFTVHPGGKDADPGRQPASASRATPGAVVPGRWHCGHNRCQPGPWSRPWPIGALVSAWPALALAGSFELLMMVIRSEGDARRASPAVDVSHPIPSTDHGVPLSLTEAPILE